MIEYRNINSILEQKLIIPVNCNNLIEHNYIYLENRIIEYQKDNKYIYLGYIENLEILKIEH